MDKSLRALLYTLVILALVAVAFMLDFGIIGG